MRVTHQRVKGALRLAGVVLTLVGSGCECSERSPPDPEPSEKGRTPSVASGVVWTDADSPIKSDERVMLFPSPARFEADKDAWIVDVHGWIFEPELRDAKRSALILALDAALELDPSDSRGELFEQRARALLADSERGKRVPVAVASQIVRSEPSGVDGHFRVKLSVARAEFEALRATEPGVVARALTRPGDDRRFTGAIIPIPDSGLTIVSDIDDTVRISHVKDLKKLLRGVLLEPFEVVPGMAARYQGWLTGADDRLHFVSASPWQLYPALDEMARDAGFPPALYDLRQVNFSPAHVDELLQSSGAVKRDAVQRIVSSAPGRTFVLVGDSGEGDPEMYGDIARQFPSRVVAVYIREVEGGDNTPERFSKAFAELPRERWATFHSGDDLPASLRR